MIEDFTFLFDFKAAVIVLGVVRVEDGYFLFDASTGGAAVRLGLEARFLAVDAAGRCFPPGRALAPVFSCGTLGKVLLGGLKLLQEFDVIRVALPAEGSRCLLSCSFEFLGFRCGSGHNVSVLFGLSSSLSDPCGLTADDASGF